MVQFDATALAGQGRALARKDVYTRDANRPMQKHQPAQSIAQSGRRGRLSGLDGVEMSLELGLDLQRRCQLG